MPKTRSLSDLYIIGREVSIDDGTGEPVKVWIQKLNPIQHEQATRKASAKRAKTLKVAKLGLEDDLRDSVSSDVFDVAPTRDDLIEYLVADAVGRAYQAKEAELASEEEWSKDNMLQGLRDSWMDELAERFIDDPDDEEALAVKQSLEEFNNQLNKKLEVMQSQARREFSEWTHEKLHRTAVDKFIEQQSDLEWLKEYRYNEILFGTRCVDDHKMRYFSSREEVDELPTQIVGRLVNEFTDMNMGGTEGK